MANLDDFVCIIATHGRPDNIKTIQSLRLHGYTGPIIILIDNLDDRADEYLEKFGDDVYIFDKEATARDADMGDNFWKLSTIIHARNAAFDVAEDRGYKYFITLDDDYTGFRYAFSHLQRYDNRKCCSLDRVFESLLKFYKNVPRIKSIALAQGGDFMGGMDSAFAKNIALRRKCMNSFICSTERRFKFFGSVNEDVNTYTTLGSRGELFFTINLVLLNQCTTQTSDGGMTDVYKESGTYVKSFYSILYHPSSIRIRDLGRKFRRLHHSINWKHTVPCILSEDVKKKAV